MRLRTGFAWDPPEPAPVPLVCVHGWLGDGRDFAPLAKDLATRQVVALDLAGHGPDPTSPAGSWTDAVASLAASFPQEPCDGLGYSMGGRLLWSALVQGRLPQVRRAVIVSAHPGLVDDEAQRRRYKEDDTRAQGLEDPGLDLEAFLDAWYRAPLFGKVREAEGYAAMLARRREGAPSGWAQALRVHSVARQAYLGDASQDPRIHLVCGDEDLKYAALYSDLGARGFDVTHIAGAAHAPHVDRPGTFARVIEAILA